jgi:hypothetical protein
MTPLQPPSHIAAEILEETFHRARAYGLQKTWFMIVKTAARHLGTLMMIRSHSLRERLGRRRAGWIRGSSIPSCGRT